MPRAKERNLTVIRSFALEKSLVDRLEEEAHKRRISVSRFVEMILIHALSMQIDKHSDCGSTSTADTHQPVAVEDPPVDPLVEIDLDEISKSIAKLEDKLRRAQTTVKRKEMRLTEQSLLLAMWNEIKKKYVRIRRQAPKHRAIEISRKLAELKKIIDKLA